MRKSTADYKDQIIKLYSEGKSSYEIAKLLEIGATSVRRLLHEYEVKLAIPGTPKVKQNLVEESIRLYREGISAENIAKQLGIHATTVCRHLKKNGIELRPATEATRRLELNEHWLDAIDTEEKAYFLGLMLTDGNVSSGRAGFKIGLTESDVSVLEKLSCIFYGENRVKQHGVKDNSKKFCVLYIYGQYITNKLIELGIEPNKTFKTRFPQWLDRDLYPHFFRGLIDGDGCIAITNPNNKIPRTIVDFTGTLELINDIEKILKEKLDINMYIYKPYRYKSTNDYSNNIYECRINGFNKVKKFLDWIYNDATIYIERKYQKYIEFLKIFNNYSEINNSAEDIDKICYLYTDGESIANISSQLNINHYTTFKIISRNIGFRNK